GSLSVSCTPASDHVYAVTRGMRRGRASLAASRHLTYREKWREIPPPSANHARSLRMCLLAVFFRVADDAHLVVGANRGEASARGGLPPPPRDGPTGAVAGLDPLAGGTWLGVNEHGVLVAVPTRRKTQPPPRPRSRGLLARELLACSTAASAVEQAT